MSEQKTSPPPTQISIRPGVGILSILRHLNYKAWFAMAEFVDNSLQSYVQNRSALQSLHGENFRLKVDINIDRSDETCIRIRDNAAGIAISNYTRAFRPAEIPLDRSGLSEFGMGMKSAACWFAPRWKVRTTALGEPVERTITLDIDTIVRDDIQELEVIQSSVPENDHYTEVILIDPYDKLQKRTGGKIKDHLASIYRTFLREGTMELRFNDEALSYEVPKILVAPYYKTPTETPIPWKREFSFDFGLGLKASGFAALREVGSTSTAGFSLFRRQRLIEGSLDEPYRPELVYGSGFTYRKQRLFGEIELHGFEVSHTKDGFQWEDHEQPFLELLREELERSELPLLSQAEGFRSRIAQKELKAEAAKAGARVADSIQNNLSPILEEQSSNEPFIERIPESVRPDPSASTHSIDVDHRGSKWRITVEFAMDESIEDWISVTDKSSPGKQREITVRMAIAHPFMLQYCRPESTEIEALGRVAAAIGLAEITARDSGVPQYGTIRRNINQLLREAFSKP